MARNNHIKGTGTGFHLADHKKGITRAFLVILILFLLCFGVFSCSSYFGQKFQVYVDTDNMQLVQLDEPEPDAPAMCVHTTAGDIVAELYPDEAPDYVAELIRTRQGRAVLDAAGEDKVPLFIRLAKSCFDRPLADKDDEVFYALSMFVRFLLARNCRQPREERLKWVRIAVKTALAAAEATKEADYE